MNSSIEKVESSCVDSAGVENCIVCKEPLGKMHQVVHGNNLINNIRESIEMYEHLHPCVSKYEINLAVDEFVKSYFERGL